MSDRSDDDSDRYDDSEGHTIRDQDRFLPIANIARIMKKTINSDNVDVAKVSKEAKECVQECVSEFISFITSEASDRCHNEKRKVINGDDIIWAMQSLGFDNYVEPLKLYLQKYRQAQKGSTSASNKPDEEDVSGSLDINNPNFHLNMFQTN